jgi:hypothetical protein
MCADSIGPDWEAIAMHALTTAGLVVSGAGSVIDRMLAEERISCGAHDDIFMVLDQAADLRLETLKADHMKVYKAGSRRFNVPRSWTGDEG